MAAHHLCLLAEVSLDQFEQWQVLRAALWTFPQEDRHGARPSGAGEPSDFARRGTGLTLNTGPGVQRCRNADAAAKARRPKAALRAVAAACQACHKCLGRDRGDAVESKTAPALLDKPNSVDLRTDERSRPLQRSDFPWRNHCPVSIQRRAGHTRRRAVRCRWEADHRTWRNAGTLRWRRRAHALQRERGSQRHRPLRRRKQDGHRSRGRVSRRAFGSRDTPGRGERPGTIHPEFLRQRTSVHIE